ncbi:Cadherin domain protein [Sphingopyxis sp. LC81]|uniref:beta strand repeat-containing protein n=1 Tax=Sphingopyxis sp. LC81 TaxID=1502850 RepID=UPI00050FAE00|nr:VCBS domain-containing protein [Sphingopyxis sp. LC81]KGB52625.1 Cadherin domain protein [Sphingopyxis sp. LC81]
MDAFDNPARNGMTGPERDGASNEPSNRAVAGGEFLAAAANVTAAASVIPLAIQAILVPDASGRIVLPAGASIDDITISGTDLVITLPNGQVFIIPGGAVDVPSIVVDGDTVPASTVAQLLENLGELNPEAGVRSSGGNFADPEGPIQDAYALGDLLPYTELAFPQPEGRELIPDAPDEEPTISIVTPDQPAGALDATSSVNEAGLPARGNEPAGSNSAATSETVTGSIVIDAPDGLVSVAINGTVVTGVGQVITSPLGQLTITSVTPGNIGYSYTLADNTNANANLTDVFNVVVTDRDGDTAPARLTISIIDDVPTARGDTDALAGGTRGPETGNVLTGVGTTSGTPGADTQGADGATLTGIRGAGSESFAAPGTVQGQYGALTINANGSYSYTRNPGTPGGVSDVFTYRITDGDGDTSTATLTIAIGDAPTTITFVPGDGESDAGTIVREADLPARGGEAPGSQFDGDAASTSGTITFTATDGVGSVTIEGVTVTPGSLPQQIVSDATGTLVVTGYSYNAQTGQGSVTYVYTLKDNVLDGDGSTVSFDFTITDLDGDAASDTLDIDIIDDAPTARADLDSVTEDGPTVASGNVLTGAGGNDANATDGVADVQGADGATVTAVTGGTVGTALAGAYGTLTLNADGSYTYALNNAAQPVQGLSAGQTLTESFTYTITDGDGDTSTTTLTIIINGADDGITINGINTEGGDLTVDEDDLADGSSPDAAALTQAGSLSISTPDGLGNVTIGGTQVVTNGVFTAGTATSPLGTINITGFTPVTGADGSVIGGTFTYNYVLGDNTLTHGAQGEDNVTDSFAVIVTDSDGSTGNDSIDVRIIDDVPTALPDVDSVTEDSGNGDNPAAADGNVLTGLGGGDANATDGVADTQGADGAVVTAVGGGTLGEAFAGAYGSLTLNADGSYRYVLNNQAQPVQGLAAGETLTEVFTYTITDGDGDTATATLTITINGADDGVTINGLNAEGAEVIVNEDDLADGSSPDPAALTQPGSFTVSAPDGLGNVTIGGTQVVTNGVFTAGTATSPLGVVNITGFTPVLGADGSVIGGTFTYNYVLSDNTLTHTSIGEDFVGDSFAVVVTDSDGSSANASLDVRIIDDVPTANPDADSVSEDGGTGESPPTADGNVLTGTGGSDANATDGAADVRGADGASVTGVSFGATVGAVGAGLAGAYGTLTLNADGSYTYVLNNAAQPVQGLSAGQTLTEIFTYTITDGDGDPAPTTLTITINGADDGVTINGLDVEGAELVVDEDGLAARPGEAPGSAPNPANVTDSDSFTVSTPDGMGTVVIDSFNGVPLGAPLTLVVANGTFTPQSVTSAYGTLTVTGFTPVTGADGSVIGGTFAYNYVLNDNRADHPAMGQDGRDDSIGIKVTDADGSTASASIDVRIVDDVPDAINDGTTQTIENAPVTINVLANDVQGADSVQPSAVQLVAGSLTGTGTLVNNGDGSFTYTPGAQETGSVSFQYRIADGDGDTDVATATITLVADSAPQIGKTADVTVDEDGLAGANADNGLSGEVTSTGSASANGTITVDFGSDVPATLAGSLVLNDSAALDTQLTVNLVPVTFEKVGNDLVGSVGGNEVIRISLTAPAAGPGATQVTYGYTVTLSQAIDQAVPGSEDSDFLAGIGFTVTDNDGTTASGAFGVTIVDDLPTLNLSDTPTTVVEGATATGTWTLDRGADGVSSVNVSFGSGSATLSLAPGSSVSITQPTGTLTVNANGTFSFAAAGNQNNATNPSASFTLSAVDRDGDPTSDSLTIAITDGANPKNASPITLTVDEAAIDAIGSNPASPAEVTSGDLIFSAGSDTLSGFAFTGVAGLVANLDGTGIDLFWSMAPGGQTIIGSLTSGGPAAITISLTAPASIAPGLSGIATVTVTLADNLPHALAMAAQTQALGTVTVQATDTDGDAATGVVTVQVTDDVPTADPDTDSVTEDGPSTADGNVLTGTGGTDGNATDGDADVRGADGASVTGVSFGATVGAVGAGLAGAYGTLTLNADGSYTYVLNNAAQPVQGLSAGQTLTEIFTYTITDGDGDPAPTTLTITINGADDGVTINGLDVEGAELVVDEDGLAARPGEAPGSAPNPANVTDSDSFTVSTPDGMGNVVIDSFNGVPLGAPLTLVVANGTFTPQSVTSAYGTLTVTGFTPVTGADGSVIGGTFTYNYVLNDNRADHPAMGQDGRDDSIGIKVTDADGSTASASIDVRIVDDVPAASPEANQNVAEGATVTGTLDFVQGADSATVTAINGTALVFGGDGFSQAIDIGHGTIKVKADGSYSFTADASVAGTGSAAATYTVTDGDNDTATASISFTITDANVPTAGQTQASVDDDALTGGNPASATGDLADPNSDGDNDQATFSGLLNLDFGGDGPGSVTFAAMNGLFVNVGQESVQLGWNAGTNTLTGTGPRGVLFTVQVTNPTTGAYKVTLVDNVLHTPGGDENDATAVLGFIVSDSDGSTAPGTLRITFDDDAPTVVANTTQPVLTVDESTFGTDAPFSFASVFTPTFGADGAAATNSTTYALGITAGSTGLVDTLTNQAVVLSVVGGVVQGRTATSNELVFTVSVAANGTVTLDQSRAVVHTPNSGPDQPTSLSADNLITLTATVTDGDGDTATATANIGQNLVFEDDAPVANDDMAGLTEGGPISVTFDVDTNDTDGADGFGSRTFTSLTGTYGTITINGDGTQTYTLTAAGQTAINALAPGATLIDIFTYTLTDKDGDSDPATLTVTLTGTDDGVTITNLVPEAQGGDVSVDEDDLLAGSDTAKESLTQTGTFNISAPDGVANLTIHGVQVINNGVFTPATIPTPLGNTLNITAYNAATGEISYSYTLAAAEAHATGASENSLFENFVVTLTDVDNDTASSTLSVNIIDDVPTARPDADIVVAEDAAAVGGNLLTNDTRGADGASVTSVTIGATTTAIAPAGTTTITTANGVYTFTAAGAWTFDPNPVSNAAAVNAGFSYTITDGDGDPSTSTQAISLIDGANPIGGGSITLALDDQNLADGSTSANPDFTSGSLVFTPGSDAIASIVFASSVAGLGGGLTWLRVSDTQITGSDGARLVVTLDLVRVGNNASVTATLNDNYDDHPTINVDDLVNLGSVGVVATDVDGDTANGTVNVTVSDDLPTARPDTDAVTEDTAQTATGNVLTGVGTTNAPGSADTLGADGAAVTGVAAGASPMPVTGNVGSVVNGTYGTLTLSAGGGYTYTLNNGNATVQALGVGETLLETFTYTITDGDNDHSTTTLKITINGSNDLPTIGAAATAVSDEGLPGGFPDTTGTVDTTNLTVRNGTIAATDLDGDALTFSLGAPATALFSGGQPIVWDTTNPQLLLGKVGGNTIISVSINNSGNFTVTLSAPIDHPNTTVEDALSLVVPVSVNDGTTTVTNATALTIGLEDDSPIAIAPLAAALINAPGSSVYQSLDTDGDVDNNYGGDGPGSVIFTAATIAALQAQNLTAGGLTLNYVISAGGTVLTAEKPNGDDVFIIRLQPAGHADQYQVQMVQKLDSTQTVDFNSGGYNFVGGNTAWVGFVKTGDNNSQDILVTPMKNGVDGGTVNANNTETGVDNNNVGANEAVRVDFVIDLTGSPANGQDYGVLANQNHAFDSHYNANGASALFTNINSSSSVRLVARDDIDTDNDIGDGVKDTITKVAISFNNATLSVAANGTYNVGGQNFTVTFANGEATVAGVVANTVVAGFTADGYNSIEFHHAGGDTFKIGDFGAVVQTENPVNFNVPVTIVDGDGDNAQASLAITTASPLLVIGSATADVVGEPTDHVVANPQGQADGAVQGGAFDDTLVGDPGSVTITEGQQANIVLVLDSSGSMTTQIDFDGGQISRMQALKNGVNALIDSLSQSGALDVRITVIDFDNNGTNLGTFNLIVNGVVQTAQVTSAKAAVNGMSASGGTNYEDGLQDALSWINGNNGIAGADVNKVVFVSDGLPTLWNSGGTGSDSDATNVQNSMDQVLGSDGTNEPQQILATGYSIDSIGINVNSTLLARLSDVEDGNASGGTGSATNADSAEELAAVLQVLGGSTDLAAAANDTINGGAGGDVIFGDVLFTDALATQLGVSLPAGSGWAVFQTLEGRANLESIDPGLNGGDWNRQDTIAYIRANYAALAKESGRTGGNDTINAGTGNDIVFGQEGNDSIDGGDGDDLISGGTGSDTLTGGIGNDIFWLANGEFGATETINGGANNDTILLTGATTVNFAGGTISGVETLTGSSGIDTVSMSAAQWASFGAIDLAVGADVLNVTFSGAVNISAAGAPVVSSVETSNLTGSSGADTLTLTGAQLDAIVQAAGTIDLAGGSTDIIALTSTSADLNGLADGRLVNVETVSASGAATGVTINLGAQTETMTITGSASGDALTASTGNNSVVNAGGGADTVTINAAALTTRAWTVNLGSGDAAADTVTFKHGALGFGDNTVATVSNFAVANDRIAVSMGSTSRTDGTFVTVTATQTNIGSGVEVVELVNNAWVTGSLGNDGDGSTIEGFIQAATNNIPAGIYTFIVYSDTSGSANAGIYSVSITGSANPTQGGMAVEHIMTINGVGYGNLTDLNFIGAADPIILDLGGDGYAFGATAAFDINADGAADRVTWNSSNDGILAVDLNGNGKIDSGTEIFTPGFGGGDFASGVAALASLDGNGDGVIDAADAAFANLLIWQDANADGVSDAGELSSLADRGIASIATGATPTDEQVDGQAVTARGGFTREDGTSGDYIEVQLDTQLGARAPAREAEDVQRAAGNQALTSSLVAASLIVGVQNAQPDSGASPIVAAKDEPGIEQADGGVAAASIDAAATAAPLSAASDSLAETPKTAAHDTSATPHSDEASPAAIDGAEDSGWRSEPADNADAGNSDSLADMIADRGSFDPGVMDGLLALAAVPAEAAAAAHDPAAAAVLAEVLESGASTVDQLIHAVTGGAEPVQVAAGETPAFDLAQFLDQQIAPDVAFPTSQALEADLHQMAAA